MHLDDYKLILLDFDGLLVDTERLHFAAYQKMCQDRGYLLSWNFSDFCQIAHHCAEGLELAIYAAFPTLKEQEPSWKVLYQEKSQAYQELLMQGKLQLMMGAAELLEYLSQQKKPHCVVTNSSLLQITCIQKTLPKLSSIPLWITREDYLHPKPAPDGYLLALKLYGVPPEFALGFEDSLKGLKALYAAGVRGALVCPNEHPQMKDPLARTALHYTSLLEVYCDHDTDWD